MRENLIYRRADAALFGYDFQVNAAIMILLDNITEMKSLFKGCKNLSEIDLSYINTSNIKSLYNLFYECKNLTYINFSNLNLNHNSINTIEEMFTGCTKLKEIVLNKECEQILKEILNNNNIYQKI